VNLLGAAAQREVIVPTMVRSGRGHISVVLSSQAILLVQAEFSLYAASKPLCPNTSKAWLGFCRPHGVAVSTCVSDSVDTKWRALGAPFMYTSTGG